MKTLDNYSDIKPLLNDPLYSDYDIEEIDVKQVVDDNDLLNNKSILDRRSKIWGYNFSDYHYNDIFNSNPIRLSFNGDKYTVLDGNHRLIALYNDGYDKASALVKRNSEVLDEDLAATKNYYPKISQEDFDTVVELDPTFDRSKDRLGSYGKWLLGLFSRDQLTDNDKVKELLKDFDANKNNLKNKDIMAFKTIDDLESYLNNEDNYKELSKKQQLRQTQKAVRKTDVTKDADLVYEDEHWEVWVPKTYEASCKLGRDTSWCTATTEDSGYYNQYTKQGSLYININKQNPEEKYQFHFESDQFMDKQDRDIDLTSFFSDKRGLLNFYAELGYEKAKAIKTRVEDIDNFLLTGVFLYRGYPVTGQLLDEITKVEIAPNVTSIGKSAFSDCSNLESVTIPDNVTNIGWGAFADCGSLTSITIGNGVTSIENNAFNGCSSLTNVTIPNSVISIGRSAFYECSSLTSVTIPDSVTSIGDYAFYKCSSLTSITIPNNVTSIGVRVFSGCENLTSITIPDSVKSIGTEAFKDCISLANITIGNSVTSIGDYAFENCTSLTHTEIPDSVIKIGEGVFYWCTSLANVVIGSGITSIISNAFAGCNSLTSILFGGNVADIGYNAFFRCSNLTDVYYSGTEEDWGEVDVEEGNRDLLRATTHFNSKQPKTESLTEAFEVHEELNPKLFENDYLKKEIRDRLIEIAEEFINQVKEDEIPIKVHDYWLVGSNASYNYTNKSDIDLHIIVDIENTENPKLIEIIYNLLKSKFNSKYDISIKGHEVEVYLEDINSTVLSNGIYSVKKNEWIKKPEPINVEPIDVEDTEEYNKLLIDYNNLEDSDIETFIDNLYILRKESLAKDGEYGLGNLIFKEFRNNGYLDELKDRLVKIRSKELTLEGMCNNNK